MNGAGIRVHGTVQGVGFRPFVWRLAHELGLGGEVLNDGAGVLIRAWGPEEAISRLCERLLAEPPPLARIESLSRSQLRGDAPPGPFRILDSAGGAVQTGVAADAATCPECRAEINRACDRRHRYPFTNCTHCGPRLSIIRAIPYDRASTSMAAFAMCAACAAEYADPADRRFHAQPNACPDCGPRAWLEDAAGERIEPASLDARDAIEAASRLLGAGKIVAIKGIGGFHLACDARNEAAVATLRQRKRRHAKPFALMARDLAVVRDYATPAADEIACLQSAAAPVVLLEASTPHALAPSVAPGQCTLGFMLPYSPLHALLLADWDTPLVMTSGNLSDEPQCIGNAQARERLAAVADYRLLHDREIVNRLDDSVARRSDGELRVLRRARGFAPSPLALHPAFGPAPELIALGGELKSSICLLRAGLAVPSQHLGDLEDAATADEYERTIALYLGLYRLRPRLLVADAHPDYRSTRVGQQWSAREGIELLAVQHHHAHVASTMAENGRAPDGPAVLGVVLDGLGYGADGGLWGGEFLVADFRRCERAGHLAATALPGGTRALLEPWRNAYAQIVAAMGREAFSRRWGALEFARWLDGRALATLDAMLREGVNCPPSSSCGRLFDAVAATIGICRERIHYEGQAAIELEALAARSTDPGSYGFGEFGNGGTRVLDPAPLWPQILSDLAGGTDPGAIAARFQRGLGTAVAGLAARLAAQRGLDTVALSGGVFQNRLLLEQTAGELRRTGLQVLTQRQLPCNDGGLALGQAAIGAASRLC